MHSKPIKDRPGDVFVLRHEVSCAFESMHIRVRKPADEVLEVPVGEDRILRAPEHQGRNLQPAQAVRYVSQRWEAGVGGIGGNVRDETSHPVPAAGSAVGGHESPPHVRRQRRVCQGMCHTQEGIRRRSAPPMHGGVQGEPECWRERRVGGVVDSSVGQHHAREELRVIQGPARADHATPVMADRYYRPLQAQGIREVAKIVDPVSQAPERAGAF